MEKITKIPEDFLIEIPLSSEQEKVLVEQINRFNELREKELYPFAMNITEDGRVLLKEGTIIHGMSGFLVDTLDKISNSGILTGQAIGIPEDGETFYCADFHRVSKDMSMKEFNGNFTYVDGRCPFGNGKRGANTLAFVIEPREEATELLSYDCYRTESEASAITRSFVNVRGLPDNANVLSSVLYGVPSNLFCGIVLGNRLLEKKEIIKLIVKMFPDCYISTIDGVVIYNPSVDMNYNEVIELRAKKYCLEFKKNLLEDEIAKSQTEVKNARMLNQQIIDAMIEGCPSDVVARILLDNKLWQGTLESTIAYVESRKKSDAKGKK